MAVSRTDFSCPCCGGNQISDKVVSLVKDIEKELGSSHCCLIVSNERQLFVA